jgi:hypothetical protein
MNFATAGIVCARVSMLLVVAIGLFCFGERLTEVEATGVVMAVLAVFMLGRVAS